jgi:hypothetical protein
VQDFNSPVTAQQNAGVTIEQPFFTVLRQTLKVNGQESQVYVFDTPQAMESATAQVAADGSSNGTTTPSWTDDPHFYKAGSLLIVYVGKDQKILDILSEAFGPQFAGR